MRFCPVCGNKMKQCYAPTTRVFDAKGEEMKHHKNSYSECQVCAKKQKKVTIEEYQKRTARWSRHDGA